MNKRNQYYGPSIGQYMGKPIFQSIKGPDGTLVFDRIAHCDEEGCPLDQLGKNEVMMSPGLIYRQQS